MKAARPTVQQSILMVREDTQFLSQSLHNGSCRSALHSSLIWGGKVFWFTQWWTICYAPNQTVPSGTGYLSLYPLIIVMRFHMTCNSTVIISRTIPIFYDTSVRLLLRHRLSRPFGAQQVFCGFMKVGCWNMFRVCITFPRVHKGITSQFHFIYFCAWFLMTVNISEYKRQMAGWLRTVEGVEGSSRGLI